MNDVIQQLRELNEAVRKAKEDGKITLREALVILKEAGDVAMLVLPLVLSFLSGLEVSNAASLETAAGKSGSQTE